jgi:hypothetical protein
MLQFTGSIHRFEEKGEKSSWTYIEVPVEISDALNPGIKKSFRVKGFLDKHPIKGVALIPMGGGVFIIPINAAMRKGIAKKEGAMLTVKIEVDQEVYQLNQLLVDCLAESPVALTAFNKMPRSHQNYYSKWIETAKLQQTQEKRIVLVITSLERGLSYAEMLREQAAMKK